MNYLKVSTSFVAICAAIGMSAAKAQTTTSQISADSAAKQDPASMMEIVVTAQRRSESINEVPSSLQAFTGDQLRHAGVTDAASLAQVTPGLNFAESGSGAPIYTMRGVGFNTPNLSSTSPVGVYADEVAYAYPYMSNGPVFDLERVEVLKGPQGTLYGRNTTGGLINFIAAKPTSSFEGRIASEFGNYGTHNLEGYVSGPVSSTLALRLSARSELTDEGWQHSISRPDDTLGRKDKLGLRAIADWKPTDKLSAEIIANYWRDHSDTLAGQAVALIPNTPGFLYPGVTDEVSTSWKNNQADWKPVGSTQAPYKVRSDFESISGRVTYALDDNLSLISLTAYNALRRHNVNDLSGTQFEVFGYTDDGHVNSFSEEARLVGEYDRFNFTAGAYYSHDKIVDNQAGEDGQMSAIRFLRYFAQNVVDPTNQLYSAQQYANGFGNFTLNLDEVSESKSAFTNGTYKITDQFSVTGGLRYTEDDLSANGCSRDVNGTAPPIWNTSVNTLVLLQTGHYPNAQFSPGGCVGYNTAFTGPLSPNLASLNETNLAGRFSAQYTIEEGKLLYASVNRGYKSGAFPLVPTNNASQLAPAKQEEVMAYEVGAKAQFFDRQLQLTAAAYHDDYNNKQLFSEIPDIVFTTLTRIVNIPRSQINGGEMEADWRSRSGFNARMGVSRTQTEVLKYNGYNQAGDPVDFHGQSFANTPKWQINGGVGYTGNINDGLGFVANVNANYQSRTSSSLLNEPGYEIKAYTTVNSSVTLLCTDSGLEFSLFGKNIFNSYYWTSANYYADTIIRLPGEPRTFGGSVAWSF